MYNALYNSFKTNTQQMKLNYIQYRRLGEGVVSYGAAGATSKL
jgi:hypothetical protein